jgi:hypothetical protein
MTFQIELRAHVTQSKEASELKGAKILTVTLISGREFSGIVSGVSSDYFVLQHHSSRRKVPIEIHIRFDQVASFRKASQW